MLKSPASNTATVGRTYIKDTLVKGKPAKLECVDINGQTFSISRGAVTTISLEDEWYQDLQDPYAVIAALKANELIEADLFTFWQRLPDLEPRYRSFHMEWEEIAALPITTYDRWWNSQIKSRVRSLIRKAEKEGVTVKETQYDDEFVQGLTAIFNESPVRQGRKFWHYGKSFETVKQQFARYINREYMLGAYFQGEMIGLMMLGNAGRFGLTGQIIASLKHRDKYPNNALIAKAVEVCEKQNLGHLCYLYWSEDSLAEFKRRCGFEKTRAPRYFAPLTITGKLALKCGAHHGWKGLLPSGVKVQLKRLRKAWHQRRQGD